MKATRISTTCYLLLSLKTLFNLIMIFKCNYTDFEAIINPTFLPKNKLERIIVEPADPRGEPLPEQLLA